MLVIKLVSLRQSSEPFYSNLFPINIFNAKHITLDVQCKKLSKTENIRRKQPPISVFLHQNVMFNSMVLAVCEIYLQFLSEIVSK